MSDAQTSEIRVCLQCNEKCIHCFNEKEDRKQLLPSLNEIYKQIDSAKPSTIIGVLGGEPTLRDDLVDILRYIKETGRVSNLFTNGYRLYNNREYLESLLPYLDAVIITIHSSDYEVFDSVTQIKGSAERSFSVLKDLLQVEDLIVMTQTVINELNYKTLSSTFDILHKLHPFRMLLTFPAPLGFAKTPNITPRYSIIKEHLCPVINRHGDLITIRDIPQCCLPQPNKIIDMLDNCPSAPRVKIMSCKDCVFNDTCIGVWREYTNLYSDLEVDLIPITGQSD